MDTVPALSSYFKDLAWLRGDKPPARGRTWRRARLRRGVGSGRSLGSVWSLLAEHLTLWTIAGLLGGGIVILGTLGLASEPVGLPDTDIFARHFLTGLTWTGALIGLVGAIGFMGYVLAVSGGGKG